MHRISRRRVVLGAVGVGLFSVASWNHPLAAQNSAQIPQKPMLLTRKLIRELGDGSQIIVERQWRVNFSQSAAGISISGSQVDVAVTTPPALAQFAEIEKSRSTNAMFPISLSNAGDITNTGRSLSKEALEAALSMANNVIEQSGADKSERARHEYYLSQLQQRGGALLNQAPVDLFFPKSKGFNVARGIDLPDGSKGEFVVSYSVKKEAQSGLLSSAKREVITTIGTSSRRTIELWTLASNQ